MANDPGTPPRITVNGVFNTGHIAGSVHVAPEGPVTDAQATHRDDFYPLVSRMGFSFDLAGYSGMSGPQRDLALEVVPQLVKSVLREVELAESQCLIQFTGDGANVFLPYTIAPVEVLGPLSKAWRRVIDQSMGSDGRDPRVRVAMIYGEVGRVAGGLGLRGRAVVALTRMLDSGATREQLADSAPGAIALAVHDPLMQMTVLDGYSIADLSPEQFSQVQDRGVTFWIGLC